MATELPHQPLRSFTYYETVERDEPEPLPSELNTVSKHHALQARMHVEEEVQSQLQSENATPR